MDIKTKIQINKLIDEMLACEERQYQKSILNSERIFYDIITPLLEEEGYEVDSAPSYDNFIDLTAKNQDGYSIGVEFKSRKLNRSRLNLAADQLFSQKMTYDRLMFISSDQISDDLRSFIDTKYPGQIEMLDLKNVRAWLNDIFTNSETEEVYCENIIKKTSILLAEAVASSVNFLQNIEWRDLERMLAMVLDELGFDVELTPGSKDGGKDLIAQCNFAGSNRTYLIEVKHWRSSTKVGISHINSFVSVILKEKADRGLFLSSGGYNNNVFESLTVTQKKHLTLGNSSNIHHLCQLYTKKRSGIWTPPEDISSLIFESNQGGT